jgi:hypothetical protein
VPEIAEGDELTQLDRVGDLPELLSAATLDPDRLQRATVSGGQLHRANLLVEAEPPTADNALVAFSSDYEQLLRDRGDVYDPGDPGLGPTTAPVIVAAPAVRRSRFFGLDAIRFLVIACVLSWAIVGVETWFLVR